MYVLVTVMGEGMDEFVELAGDGDRVLEAEWVERTEAEVERAGGGRRRESLRGPGLSGSADPGRKTGGRRCDVSWCGGGHPEVKVEAAQGGSPTCVVENGAAPEP